MDRIEFSRQLDELQREMFRAFVSYQVRMALWETPEVVDILNRWRGFFVPVRDALYSSMLLGLSKVFDGDRRTMSLRNLIEVAKGNAAELVPRMSVEDVGALEDEIAQHEDTLASIKRLRDQHLAHLDAKPEPKLPLVKKDLDQLIDSLKEVFNRLSSGHRGTAYGWSFQEDRSTWETQEILRILSEEAARGREEADRLMRELGSR